MSLVDNDPRVLVTSVWKGHAAGFMYQTPNKDSITVFVIDKKFSISSGKTIEEFNTKEAAGTYILKWILSHIED